MIVTCAPRDVPDLLQLKLTRVIRLNLAGP